MLKGVRLCAHFVVASVLAGPAPSARDTKTKTQTLGLQIDQSRYYLYSTVPKVGTICILGDQGKQSTK